ncbi:IspA Geranylgeranyl pyrophosphate synthase [Candidatus Nanopelagicaceae bacterium]
MSSEPKATLKSVRSAVEEELSIFLNRESAYLNSISSDLSPVSDSLTSFLLDSGKRLRPLFAYAGFAAAGGRLEKSAIRAMAALELLQACALIHDDLMDGSDTRRGKPSIHRHFESVHVQDQLDGFAPQYGLSAAVLLGDLALVWSDQMLNTAGLTTEQFARVLPFYNEMRVELMAGQFLDIHEQTQKDTSVDRSMKIARYKSGKYTIERPLHLGAAMTSSSKEVTDALSAYGLPLGEAFQLRDDLLGVFGDPSVTGKPAGDDLREGKRTVLIAMTHERQSPAQLEICKKYFGKPDIDAEGVATLQEIIESTGARAELEATIDRLTDQALTAAQSQVFTVDGKALLVELANIATKRSS